MLQHLPSNEPGYQMGAINTGTADTGLDARSSAHIEDFLDRVFARVVSVVPYEEHCSRREAMRARIEQYCQAHLELGSSYSEAVVLALSQIEREQAVAAHARTQVQLTRTAPPSARTSTLIALGFVGFFYVLDQSQTAGHLWDHWIARLYDNSAAAGGAVSSFYRFELLALPLICGLATGLLSRARPVRGFLNALTLLAIPTIVWAGIPYGLMYAGIGLDGPGWLHWLQYVFPNPKPAVAAVGCWAILGCLAAGTGGWIRRRISVAPKAIKRIRSRFKTRCR